MQINGMQNKFEMFQDFYYVMNGVQISYSEALRLFAQMDAETAADFEKYCKDEVGYEIITPSGYNFGSNIDVKTYKDGDVEKVVRVNGKVVKLKTITNPDGTKTTVETNSSTLTQNDINRKYTLEAYAKKNGLVLDPQWAIYSAEEIIAMADNGVNIPQDVVDIANTIMQSAVSAEGQIEGEDGQEDTTLSFLELIPLAEKKIEKCDKNNEKIENEIQELLPEQQKRKRKLGEQMKEQRRSLKEYEAFVREWNHIQTKINNGEALSTREARRYADLMGMFEEKKSGEDKGFSLDKREIAKSMNEINILAILGEKLADETIVIGDTLADYTSKANYKTTRRQAQGEIGFLRSIVAMINGKTLAKEAAVIGNDTKDFTAETQQSVNDIASVLEIDGMIAGKDEVLGTEQPKEASVEGEEAVQEGEAQPVETTDSAQGEDKNPEVTEQEDFVINDKNVKELIKESAHINSDLLKQTVSAIKSIKVAKNDRKFAKIAGIKVTKLVKQFQKQEEERQARIQAMEQENKEANQELENLTGKSADELNEEQPAEKTQEGQQPESDKEKVVELRQKIASNNEEIENIKVESEESKGEFANATAKESEIISQAIPAEAEALKKDTEYKEEIIPAAKERLDFTDASGETLSKIGVYRIELGMMQIMAWQLEKGLKNVALGAISTGIGLTAQIVGDSPMPTIAEKATNKAIKEEDKALNDLTTLEAEIISVTGAEATQLPAEENEEDENSVEGAENTDETTTTEGAEQAEEAVTEAEETTGVETPVVEEPSEETPTAPADETSAQEPTVEEPSAENTESTESSDAPKEEKEQSPEAMADNAESQEKQITKQTDKQEDAVKAGAKTAKDAGKESKKIEKDEKKDAKQLEKEAKKLEKQIKKEEEEVIALTQESQKAVEKQQEILVEYEMLTAENEKMAAEEEANQMSAPKKAPQQKQDGEQGGALASNSFTIVSTSDGTDNQSKLAQNDMRINELGVEFKSQDRIVVRNRAKITIIQDSIKNKSVKFEKKLQLKDKKIKETEKKEKEKQKKLNKVFGAIGIAENIFSITSTTGLVLIQVGTPMEASGAALITAGTIQISVGTALLSNPFTAAAGAALVSAGTVQVTTGTSLETSGITLQTVGGVLKIVGLAGSAACGVTKGIINVANGNLAAGLMALGATAVSVATSFAGGGAAAGSALNYVSEGLSIVSSSAELVNNVRAVQGKEANGVMSKISTIAGVGSAATGAASSLSNMGSQNTIGKISTITSAVGTALSSTSQIMTEFGGDEKTANLLGTIGGGLQTLGSIGQLANKNNNTENKDENETKEKTNVDDEVNKSIDNDKNLTPEQKAEAKAAVDKFKNDPKFKAQVEGTRDSLIDQKLNEMGLNDKQKAQVKQKLKQSGNYNKSQETQQAAQPENKKEETKQPEKQEKTEETKTTTTPAGTVPETEGKVAPAATAAEKPAETPALEVTDTQAEAAEALRSETPAETSSSADVETVETVETKTETPEVDDEIPTFTEEELAALENNSQATESTAATQEAPEIENTESLEEFKKTNMEENGASEEFADLDDDLLEDYRQEAMGQGDEASVAEYENEQAKRAEFKKNKAKEAKTKKIENILDITGQAANTAMSVAGMFMTQKEGEAKKKHAVPGKLTKRTKEIMKKNALYRQRRVQALAKAQKYYA